MYNIIIDIKIKAIIVVTRRNRRRWLR